MVQGIIRGWLVILGSSDVWYFRGMEEVIGVHTVGDGVAGNLHLADPGVGVSPAPSVRYWREGGGRR